MLLWHVLLGGFLVLVGAASVPAEAGRERSVQSPSHTVALLELYTSEG
jgi:hypothetical protein